MVCRWFFFWVVDRILVSGGFQVDVQFYKLPPFLFVVFFILCYRLFLCYDRMYYTSPSPIFTSVTIHILSNLDGLTNGTNHLFLLYHYSKFTYLSFRILRSFLLLLASTSSPITMLFLQDTFQQASKLHSLQVVQPILNYLTAFQKKLIDFILPNNRSKFFLWYY